MNIDTDTQWSYWSGVKEFESKYRPYLQTQIGNPDGAEKPNKKYYDPREMMRAAEVSTVAASNSASRTSTASAASASRRRATPPTSSARAAAACPTEEGWVGAARRPQRPVIARQNHHERESVSAPAHVSHHLWYSSKR